MDQIDCGKFAALTPSGKQINERASNRRRKQQGRPRLGATHKHTCSNTKQLRWSCRCHFVMRWSCVGLFSLNLFFSGRYSFFLQQVFCSWKVAGSQRVLSLALDVTPGAPCWPWDDHSHFDRTSASFDQQGSLALAVTADLQERRKGKTGSVWLINCSLK